MILVGLLVLVAALGFQLYRATRPPKGGDPHNDIPALKATKTFDYVGGDHTSDPVKYAQTPPAGGPHDPTWDRCGAYDTPPRNENAVHDLEHGTVWITYRPGLDAADIASLQTQLEGKDKPVAPLVSRHRGGLPGKLLRQLVIEGQDD